MAILLLKELIIGQNSGCPATGGRFVFCGKPKKKYEDSVDLDYFCLINLRKCV